MRLSGKKLKDFKDAVGDDGGVAKDKVADLKRRVVEFSKAFPVVGWDQETMKFK